MIKITLERMGSLYVQRIFTIYDVRIMIIKPHYRKYQIQMEDGIGYFDNNYSMVGLHHD